MKDEHRTSNTERRTPKCGGARSNYSTARAPGSPLLQAGKEIVILPFLPQEGTTTESGGQAERLVQE